MNSRHTRVLITPAGTETGLEIYKSLSSRKDIQLFGLDTDPLNPLALLLGKDHFHTTFNFDTPEFLDILNKLCNHHKIDFIYPTHDYILPILQSHPKAIVSSPDAISTTTRKTRTHTRLGQYNIPLPKETESLPCFFRNDFGRGSKGAKYIDDWEILWHQENKYPNNILTEYLSGKEYTVDCINSLDGKLLGHCIRERINIKRGITHIGRTIIDEEISCIAEQVSRAIPGIKGGWFFQVKRDNNNIPKVLEVNLRVSGTMCLTRTAGLNIPLITVMLFRGDRIESVEIPRKNVIVVRHLTEEYQNHQLYDATLVIWDLDDTLLNGTITNNLCLMPHLHVVDTIIDLHRHGVRQTICSHNRWLTGETNPIIRRRLQKCCLPEHLFSVIRIDSNLDKMDMISNICNILGVDYQVEKVILIDDSFKARKNIQEKSKNKIITMEPSIIIGR